MVEIREKKQELTLPTLIDEAEGVREHSFPVKESKMKGINLQIGKLNTL